MLYTVNEKPWTRVLGKKRVNVHKQTLTGFGDDLVDKTIRLDQWPITRGVRSFHQHVHIPQPPTHCASHDHQTQLSLTDTIKPEAPLVMGRVRYLTRHSGGLRPLHPDPIDKSRPSHFYSLRDWSPVLTVSTWRDEQPIRVWGGRWCMLVMEYWLDDDMH